MRILIVEDNKKVASFLAKSLREVGHTVDVEHDGAEAAVTIRIHDFDLLVLDVMLPSLSGLSILAQVRADGRSTPVLVLTALDTKAEIVEGLNVGADDYLTKPFALEEFLARVRALLRRGGATRAETLRFEEVTLDLKRHVATRGTRRLSLTPKEFQLLEFFMLNPERVVRRTELLDKVWDLSFDPMSNVVDVHVANLRKRLGAPVLIQTVRGVGYILTVGRSAT